MLDESFQTSTVLVACGVGLAAIGAGRALFASWRRKQWILPIGGSIAIAVASLGSTVAAARVALIVAGVLAAWALMRSRNARVAVLAGAAVVHKPAAVAAIFFVAGLALAICGVVGIERVVPTAEFQEFALFDVMSTMPSIVPEPAAYAQSDCGSPIRLRIPANAREFNDLQSIEQSVLECLHWRDCVIRRQRPSDNSNCHGWIFTGGQYWLTADEVERILDDNGYDFVTEPRPGDLAIYRNRMGGVAHSAVVRAVCDDGVPIVEGKWGWMGVFLHRACDSCYGQDYIFLRSDRDGHRLTGLPTLDSNPVPTQRTD